ncbi:MAG: Maf family protein [Acidobacteria bacterium]|nr:Maf family protein [Acidobacteriota bacterium]
MAPPLSLSGHSPSGRSPSERSPSGFPFRNNPARKIILASASPRRSEILRAAGINYKVIGTSIRERQRKGEPASKFVARMAAEKAAAVLARLPEASPYPILGADTVVVVGRRTLGKPASVEEARRMLRLLSGKKHTVLTGLCLLWPSSQGALPGTLQRVLQGSGPRPSRKAARNKSVRVVATTVKFCRLTEQEIEQYVATREPLGKAGAYAIQGGASKFAEWVHGCYFNVVGLPVSVVYLMLKKIDTAGQD